MAYLDNQGVEYLWSKLSLEDYPNNEVLMAVLNAIDETKLDKEIFEEYIGQSISTVEPQPNDIPTVYIDGTIPENKNSVFAEMTYVSKTETFHAYLDIKCQGTSSLSYPKKNFTIKLFQDEARKNKLKKNFLGWGDQNKFCLKANWIDISHARNVVSARLWSDIVKSRPDYENLPTELKTSPNHGAIDGFPIRVFCNGIYWGRYTWNIPKDGWMSNMDDDLDTHCILCGENYESGCFRALANIDETDWSDELHDTVPTNILTSWNNAISFVMNSTDEDFIANIENHFNLQSLIDYYLFSYAICHLDGLGKNQLFFTYDGIHWIASAYDLDSTFGLYWNGESFVSIDYRMPEDYEPTAAHNTSNLLYDRLSVLFKEQIKTRWNELYSNILKPINIITHLEKFTNICSPYLIAEDYSKYTANGNFINIPSQTDNNINQLREYIVKRLAYVDSMINPLLGEVILRENYTPNGETWIDTTHINFAKGDYIEISIDTSTVPIGNTLENIISIGDTIGAWNQNIAGYHLYYSPGTGTGSLEVNTFAQAFHISRITVETGTNILIKIDKNGIYVDNKLVIENEYVTGLSSVQIGSAEGMTRSNATYNYIKVVAV